jgi:hypothetical protein
MKNQDILNNINEMKYLFGYRRGKVISEQSIYEVEEIGTAADATTTTTTVAGSSTTTKTTRRATGLEVQKLLNTKYNLGLKEDGVIGPLTRGAIMTALEGGSATSSSGSASTTASTTVAGSTTASTTVAGATTQTSTAATSGGGGGGASTPTGSSDV